MVKQILGHIRFNEQAA